MNITKLLTDYNISFSTEGRNHTEGWIMMQCPFCNDSGEHLGYNLKDNYFNCWKCGWKSIIQGLCKLLSMPTQNVYKTMQEYGSRHTPIIQEKELVPRFKGFKYPSGTGELQVQHKKYLIIRDFNPEQLEKDWGLLGTNMISGLDGRDYKHRIIAPITWNGKPISYQGRSIVISNKLRYKACPKEREIIHHKHILYGRQDKWGDRGICVEGITDVWRLGFNAFAMFGIAFTTQQVNEIVKQFKQVYILFDNQPQAQKQARKLSNRLKLCRVENEIINIGGEDPASMTDVKCAQLLRQLDLGD